LDPHGDRALDLGQGLADGLLGLHGPNLAVHRLGDQVAEQFDDLAGLSAFPDEADGVAAQAALRLAELLLRVLAAVGEQARDPLGAERVLLGLPTVSLPGED